MKDHESLLSAILAVKFDFLRINDVVLSDDVYNIDFYTAKNSAGESYDGICMVNPKKDEYSVSEHQLAGLRLAKGPITSQWLDEFPNDANGERFKDWVVKTMQSNPNLSLKDLRFKVVAQIKVRNTAVGGDIPVPVYQDKCYLGAMAFKKGVLTLTKGKAGNRPFFSSSEYRLGMSELREALHASGVNPKVPLVEVKLPIFTVV